MNHHDDPTPATRIDDVAIAATTQAGDQGLTIGRTAALLAGLRPGPSEQGGQDMLREAFTSDNAAEPNPVHALERGEIDAAQFEQRPEPSTSSTPTRWSATTSRSACRTRSRGRSPRCAC